MSPALEAARARSAARIAADVRTLSRPPFTAAPPAVCRYAYTPEWTRTVRWVADRLAALGFAVSDAPLGTLVARNVPAGAPSVGVGSHLDSVRRGGAWDGTLGVVMALELARLDAELGLGLPLTVIAWLEEEGAGFGRLLLGSGLAAGDIGEAELRREIRALDDGRPFWDVAGDAGRDPARWRDSARALDGLVAWVEPHIEQGRVLQDSGRRLGVVSAIAGHAHVDVTLIGRAGHAGATPMAARADALLGAAELCLAAEAEAVRRPGATATVGTLAAEPGSMNVGPGRARATLDVRAADDAVRDAVLDGTLAAGRAAADRRGLAFAARDRARRPAVTLDRDVRAALARAADAAGAGGPELVSGATHDTASLARHVPSGMLFVPCRDGVSHSPKEAADPRDAALGVAVLADTAGALAVAAGALSTMRKGTPSAV